MNKLHFFAILFAFISMQGTAQTIADTTWTKTIGGSNDESPFSFIAIPRSETAIANDGSLYIATNTISIDGWINSYVGDQDCWIIKMSTTGDTIWTRNIGGLNYDIATGITALAGGGCAVCGYTFSDDNYFTGNHDVGGGVQDGFITVFDSQGNTVWTKLYGGQVVPNGGGGVDKLMAIIQTSTGELLATGQSSSYNGDLILEFDKFYAGWALKVNATTGNKIWSKRYKGLGHNELNQCGFVSIFENSLGEYVATGSQSGVVPNKEFWEVKLNTAGVEIWNKVYGSNPSSILDWVSTSVEAENNGVLVTGTVSTQAYDQTQPVFGLRDVWIFKTDNTGNIIDQAVYGGSDYDIAYDVTSDNKGGWYVAARTKSIDNYATNGALGNADFWLLHLDTNLDTLATYRMGGTGLESLESVVVSKDGGAVYLVGRTFSSDIYIHGNNGGQDIWVAKLGQETVGVKSIGKEKLEVFPNPSTGIINVKSQINSIVEVYNFSGQKIFSTKTTQNTLQIDLSNFENGLYFIKNGERVSKFIIKH